MEIQGYICTAIFLDNGWGIVQDNEVCCITTLAVRQDLLNARLVINEEKSVWEPTHVLNWLGIIWNSLAGTLSVVGRRLSKIVNTIDRIIDTDFKVSDRELASFTGQIISTGPVVGNIARIMTKHCIMSTLYVDKWDSVFCLDDYCKQELYFWTQLFKGWIELSSG